MKCHSFVTICLSVILVACMVQAVFLPDRVSVAASPPTIAGCTVFPADNIWNTPVDTLPVSGSSSDFINAIGAGVSLHPDFGSGLWNGGPIGIPLTVVPGSQPKVGITFSYADESDPGPYPVPPDAAIEGGSQSSGDRHVLVLDRDACLLYELYAAYPLENGGWRAGSGSIFDLGANRLRQRGWTSADAAGLPILPGLVRYDEIAAGEIAHAVRFTAPQTRRDYVWPARHFASSLTGAAIPPMGQRFRLKADFNISTFSPQVQVLLRALKKYGMILADNGSAWYLSGMPDSRWNNDIFVNELKRVKGSDFEAVDGARLMMSEDAARAITDPNPNPPASPVRLIFIHHSTGQNWLDDANGALGIALRDNNYFVSDTNYGWGPDAIGDLTDIGHWWNWFRGPDSATYLADLYAESGQYSSYSRLATVPAGENEIIMFKSCFPNSALQGSPVDPVPPIGSNPLRGQGSGSSDHTVANAKGIYIDLLEYFRTRQDKLFVVIAAPPLSDDTYADNARAFNQWLVNDWLAGYPYRNVAVFDFYNVLTSNGGNVNTNDLGLATGNHHRWWLGAIQHKTDAGQNTLQYYSGDDHPSRAGNLKAAAEFLPLLNIFYHDWKSPAALTVTLSADKSTPQAVGAQVIFTAQASGGLASYEYQFRLRNPSGVWSVVRDYGTTTSWTWNTAGHATGNYLVEVWTRNTGSTVAHEAFAKLSYRLWKADLSSSSASPQSVGNSIIFTANISGGSGSYEFQFRLRNPSGVWSVVRDYSSSSSWTWDTDGLAVGSYFVEVWARRTGSTAAWESYKTMNYTLRLPVTAVSLNSDKPSPQARGTSIIFTAAATGASGSYVYQYRLRTPSGVWSVVRDYSSSASWTWNTSAGQASGSYLIEVWAKNSGSNAAWEAYRNMRYTLQ